MLTAWWNALLDLLYPPRCPACRASVGEQGAWCSRCLPDKLCLRELAPEGRLPSALDLCCTILPYDGTTKRLLHRLKFKPDPATARYFKWLLTNKVNWAKLPVSNLVVPVPLSPQRIAKRGFNQTELLFHPWCREKPLPWGNALIRTRDTQPQWQLTPLERSKNIKGAFNVIDPESVRSKTILLVDDILTTGLTMNECARTLKKAGAIKVHGLALASGAVSL